MDSLICRWFRHPLRIAEFRQIYWIRGKDHSVSYGEYLRADFVRRVRNEVTCKACGEILEMDDTTFTEDGYHDTPLEEQCM